jgi:hypothetical protein
MWLQDFKTGGGNRPGSPSIHELEHPMKTRFDLFVDASAIASPALGLRKNAAQGTYRPTCGVSIGWIAVSEGE